MTFLKALSWGCLLVMIIPLTGCAATVKFKPNQFCGSYKVSSSRALEVTAKADQTLSVEVLDNTDNLEISKEDVDARVEVLEGVIYSHLLEDGTYTVIPYPINPKKPMLLRVCVLDEDRD